MKITAKKIIPIFCILTSLGIGACNSPAKHNHDTEATAEEAGYACPMHPDVVGKEGDECSKCGMKLEPVSKEASENKYFMDFKAMPSVESGKDAVLLFTPKIKGKENESVPLSLQHDKKMHLIVVSKDLSYFDHIHPEFQADGSYKITVLPAGKSYTTTPFSNETKFAQGGDYILFADYLPSGASHQLERIALNVAGTTSNPKKYTEQKTISAVDGYEVSLTPEGGKFLSNGTLHITAIIKKDGKEIPADELENYLAAKAHVVVVSEDTEDYLHVHPEVADGRLDLHTSFGRAGIFRGWLQFQTEGKVHTADFVINVEEGTAPESAHGTAEHAH